MTIKQTFFCTSAMINYCNSFREKFFPDTISSAKVKKPAGTVPAQGAWREIQRARRAVGGGCHCSLPLSPAFFDKSVNVIVIKLVIRDSQVLAKLVVVTIFFIGWGQTARLQRVRQNTVDRIQTETEQQQTARLQRVRQNTADRILKFDKRYKAFEIAGYFQKHREIIG